MKLKYYFQTNWLQTLFFNFRKFPLHQALHLPVIFFRGTEIRSMKGKIYLPEKVRHGMIKIGRADVTGWEGRKTVMCFDGEIVFKGKAIIGSGSVIDVKKDAVLTVGSKFRITAGTTIYCRKAIEFGNEVLISWDTLIMDSDHHCVCDLESGKVLNNDLPVVIGDHVWIGCRNTLLKGACVGDDCVVAAGSILTGNFSGERNAVIGGRAGRVLRSGIRWQE